MDFSTNILLVFPAFLMGSVFGILIVLMRPGTDIPESGRAMTLCVLASLAGGVIFLLTQSLWPPFVGPFILCPVLAGAAGLIAGKHS